MYLKSISLKGFKSFPERTRLEFSPGVSVIVGPNGCGKSNLTDAVLWVLGEQSPLAVRGQSMQDVIFAGGSGSAPRQFAEVEVVLDNSDGPDGLHAEFSELAIRRRLDRSGNGEYRLNGARCRLTDIVEILADANLGREMHSVISQGRVSEVVSSKPQDRRLLVEEAAGLGKHRLRRRRAELKLRRTQENLDRALDVEREARSHLRPLRRQAKAAESHARLEREGLELRARLVADELRVQQGLVAEAEKGSGAARAAREALEERLGEASKRRLAVEERLAARDRERTELWARLTALRAAHERLTVRTEALGVKEAELRAGVERGRETLGALAAESASEPEGSDPVATQLMHARAGLEAATQALAGAERAEAEEDQLREVARLRSGAERATRAARRAELHLGRKRQGSLERRVTVEAELLEAVGELRAAVLRARDTVGARTTSIETAVIGGQAGDELTDQLRKISAEEAEIQTELRGAGETFTQAEVQSAQLRDRCTETETELGRIASGLERELDVAASPLPDTEREEIEGKLARLARRREQLGPVNPLAENEYEDAKGRVDELKAQREDLESALSELEKLIRETDRTMTRAFEETLAETARNFEELVEHLFPGGRGRLRLVKPRGPRPVLGGGDASTDSEDAQFGDSAAALGMGSAPGSESSASEGAAADARDESGEQAAAKEAADEAEGVEIEVTPAGKATRRLSLLSGGEKSLVALAFVFAVFLARPSPFYILDEVEAALDEANIDRFLQLVRRFSDRAQFVIVTHQKRTMDAADVLYGVSMGAGGATKVVSRRLPRDGGEHSASSDEESAGAAEAA
jgi:chromosome segregation ATPase